MISSSSKYADSGSKNDVDDDDDDDDLLAMMMDDACGKLKSCKNRQVVGFDFPVFWRFEISVFLNHSFQPVIVHNSSKNNCIKYQSYSKESRV